MHFKNVVPPGRIIRSQVLLDEFRAKELNRRQLLARASAAAGALALAGCPTTEPADDDDDDDSAVSNPVHMVGVGAGATFNEALDAALEETIGRDRLAFIQPGDTVYLKINSNSGDLYPYSTNPNMVKRLGRWAFEAGAKRVIVGDRSFWGDPGTMGNLTANRMVEAADEIGAELMVFDPGTVDWVQISQDDAADWNGGFSFPLPVVEADHIINLPCLKTHFISGFTMGMKNIIGLVNPDDRRRDGNLDVHVTSGNKLYRQIAQLNEHITPSLTVLDAWQALIRGGPTPRDAGGAGLTTEAGNPGLIVAGTDRVAVDVTGLAILKTIADPSEAVHRYDVWENPQIDEAVRSRVGIRGPDDYDANAPTVSNWDDYLSQIMG